MASGNGVPQQVGMAGPQRMQPGSYGPSVTQPPGQLPAPQDGLVRDVAGGPAEPPSNFGSLGKRTPTPQSGPKLSAPVMPQVLDQSSGGGGKAGGRVQQAPNINQSAARVFRAPWLALLERCSISP